MSKSEWQKRIILTKAKTCLINHALECYSSLRNLKDNSGIKLNVIRQIRLAFYIEDIFCKISNVHWLEYFSFYMLSMSRVVMDTLKSLKKELWSYHF